jgi:hypothetical protein
LEGTFLQYAPNAISLSVWQPVSRAQSDEMKALEQFLWKNPFAQDVIHV